MRVQKHTSYIACVVPSRSASADQPVARVGSYTDQLIMTPKSCEPHIEDPSKWIIPLFRIIPVQDTVPGSPLVGVARGTSFSFLIDATPINKPPKKPFVGKVGSWRPLLPPTNSVSQWLLVYGVVEQSGHGMGRGRNPICCLTACGSNPSRNLI